MFDLYSLILNKLPHLGPFTMLLAHLIMLTLIVAAAVLANLIARSYLLRFLAAIVRKSKNTWDDRLFEKHVFDRLSHLAPAVVLYLGSELYPATEFVFLIQWLRRFAFLYMTIAAISTTYAFLDAVSDIYSTYEVSRSRPIKGYTQAIKVVLACMALVVVISLLTGRSPLLLLSGLGALTAVLLLIFKDPIMGVVAGIQLTGNNLVRTGDWIEVPKHRADGDVIDVSLTTVKVQNWDKTITAIPIYALVSDSFTNWRGMMESGGRRIKRSLTLDMRSIGFAGDEVLARLAALDHIAEPVQKALADLKAWRESHPVNQHPANEPRPTNVALFRAYVTAYLHAHELISDDMTFLVRQLQSDRYGLPVEIYVFCKDKRWEYYEQVQAEIMEHLLAMLPLFELRIFQVPSGYDMEHLGRPPGTSADS